MSDRLVRRIPLKNSLLKFLDRTVGKIAVLLLTTPIPAPRRETRSFLLIRPGGIGDAVLLIPTIQVIRKHFAHSKITVLAERRNAGAFRLCPEVDQILLYDRSTDLSSALCNNFDVVIDTEQWHRLSAVVARLTRTPFTIGYSTNERRKLFNYTVTYSHDDYEVDSFRHLLKPLSVDCTEEAENPFLVVPKDARERANLLLGELEGKGFITAFPGASIPERRWGAAKFAAVVERLRAKGIYTVVVGGKSDESEGKKIVAKQGGLNLAGKTSLVETAAVIDKSSLLLSGDSGILHIGAGLNKPTVSLFGPGMAKKWAPRGGKHIVLNKRLSCSPCTRFGYTPECPINAKCMADITVDEVVAAVEKLIATGGT